MRILPNWEKQELKQKLKDLTDNNQHNESRLLLTKELMLNELYNFYCDCIVILDETEEGKPALTFKNWYKLNCK